MLDTGLYLHSASNPWVPISVFLHGHFSIFVCISVIFWYLIETGEESRWNEWIKMTKNQNVVCRRIADVHFMGTWPGRKTDTEHCEKAGQPYTFSTTTVLESLIYRPRVISLKLPWAILKSLMHNFQCPLWTCSDPNTYHSTYHLLSDSPHPANEAVAL